MGTLEQKWGPNGDPKTEKGPHGDRVPQMGTHLGAVVFAMNYYQINKSNQSLTQCHTGLSGARCKVNHQTASTQLTNLQSINTSKSTIGIQSHHLSYRSNNSAVHQYIKVIRAPETNFLPYLHHYSGVWCNIAQESISE